MDNEIKNVFDQVIGKYFFFNIFRLRNNQIFVIELLIIKNRSWLGYLNIARSWSNLKTSNLKNEIYISSNKNLEIIN